MKKRVFKLLSISTITFCLQCCSSHKPKYGKIENNYLSKHEYFIDSILYSNNHHSQPDIGKTKNNLVYNPKGIVLSNLLCWSKMDSYPECITTINYQDSSKLIMKTKRRGWLENYDKIEIIKNKNSRIVEKEDPIINFYLLDNYSEINDIQLVKNEELNKGWIVMEGLFFSTVALAVTAFGELAFLPITDNFNMNRVGLLAGLSTISFVGYRYITWTDYSRTVIIRIDF